MGDMTAMDVLAHIFFIGSGVALGVRAADDLMWWKDRRAERAAEQNGA
jgi:hypothetical protein